jgi:hypothetical protein
MRLLVIRQKSGHVRRALRAACRIEPLEGRTLLSAVSFTGNGDGTTTVVLTNTGLTDREEHEHREGWLLSFANLDTVLAAA